MDEQPNLREFLDEVSSFTADDSRRAPGQAAAAGARRRSARSSRSPAPARRSASMPPQSAALQAHKDPSVAMSGQVGSQVKMVVGNSWLIANVRTLRAGDGGELVAHVDFLGEGSRDAAGRDEQLPPRRDALSDPGRRGPSGHHRGPALDLRGQRRAAHRDRHRLSDRRHPRRALRRPDAGQAFRGAGIDRYRQVDPRRADPPPHLGALRPRVTS